MKRIMIQDIQLRLHFKVQTKILDKAIKVVTGYKSGSIHARKLGCGLFKVLDVTRNERIVIRDEVLNLMTHEQYNKFVERR